MSALPSGDAPAGLRYASVCAGVEGATLAWAPLGWELCRLSEVDPFCNALLAQRFPEVPNLGDFTRIGRTGGPAPPPVGLLVGGPPCTDFSVAGRRAGLGGAAGRLALEFVALLDRVRPRWLVFENVAGLLSSHGGRDFGALLGALADLRYGFAYRVLDAQYAGVPQRRRRVFIVGYLGDWRPPAAVLLERAGLSGDPPPRRGPGTVAASLTCRSTARGSGGADDNDARGGRLIALSGSAGLDDTAGALTAHGRYRLDREETYVAYGLSADAVRRTGDALTPSPDAEGRIRLRPAGLGVAPEGAFTVKSQAGGAVALLAGGDTRTAASYSPAPLYYSWDYNQDRVYDPAGTAPAVCAHDSAKARQFLIGPSVRRLTPRECERLQGYPDDWTAISFRGRPASDSRRYRAIGNGFAVPVVRWIGERIALAEGLLGAGRGNAEGRG